MPAAVAIPAIIGAGTSVASAVVGSRAAGKAARTQEQAANRAQGFNERVYNEQKQLMSPYVNMGTESLQRLMSSQWGTPYAGPGQPTAFAGNPYAPTPHALGIPNGMAPSGPQRNPMAPNQGIVGQPTPPPLTNPAPDFGMGMRRTPPPGMAQGWPQGPLQGGMVMVEAPTGERRPLPLQQAQLAVQRGARIVGGA